MFVSKPSQAHINVNVCTYNLKIYLDKIYAKTPLRLGNHWQLHKVVFPKPSYERQSCPGPEHAGQLLPTQQYRGWGHTYFHREGNIYLTISVISAIKTCQRSSVQQYVVSTFCHTNHFILSNMYRNPLSHICVQWLAPMLHIL